MFLDLTLCTITNNIKVKTNVLNFNKKMYALENSCFSSTTLAIYFLFTLTQKFTNAVKKKNSLNHNIYLDLKYLLYIRQ